MTMIDFDRLAFDLSNEAGVGNPRDCKARLRAILVAQVGPKIDRLIADRDELESALLELVRLKEAREAAPEEFTLEARQAAWIAAYRLVGVKHRHEPLEQECGI